MTTLFNLFCPLIMVINVSCSINMLIVLTTVFLFTIMPAINALGLSLHSVISSALFPSIKGFKIFLFGGFIVIVSFNLLSLICYSYPGTTTLSFNLSLALSLWVISILINKVKNNSFYIFLPANSPWYLVPFLCLVELVSILVRPVTLCFRLLANMSAGHILLSLICKINYVWALGSLFGLLELMVCMVQGFVLTMLVMVYLEESFTH